RTTRRQQRLAVVGSRWRLARQLPKVPPAAAIPPTTGDANGAAPGYSAIASTPVSSTEHSCSCARWSSDEINRGEQGDPHDVDEVPVVGEDGRRVGLRGRDVIHR